ncbi:MAG TPA: YceI family protein [Gammaproteobacteria bacterium]
MSARKWILSALIMGASASAAAAVENFTVDSSHTYPSLEFSHMGLSVWRGKFNETAGKVKLDTAAKTGSVDITVNTASIDFGHEEMNEHARADKWLNVAKYPKMTYKGTLKFKDGVPAVVDGELTLLGVTKPVKLKVKSFNCVDVHPFYKKKVCGADLKGSLDRADFGLTQYTENGMGKIDLQIQVEAMKDD